MPQLLEKQYTVKPVYNNPPGDTAKVGVIDRGSLYKGLQVERLGT